MKPLYETEIDGYHVAFFDLENIGKLVLVSPQDRSEPNWFYKIQRWQVYSRQQLLKLEPEHTHVIYNLTVYKDCMIVGGFDNISVKAQTPRDREVMLGAMAQWFPFKSIAEYRKYDGEARFPIVQRRRYRNDEHRKVKDLALSCGFNLLHQGDDKYLLVKDQSMTLDTISKLLMGWACEEAAD